MLFSSSSDVEKKLLLMDYLIKKAERIFFFKLYFAITTLYLAFLSPTFFSVIDNFNFHNFRIILAI